MLTRAFKLFLVFFFLCFTYANATHNRAGEIIYKRIAPFSKVVSGVTVQVYTYSITTIHYTDFLIDAQSQTNLLPDRCVDTIYFGDGQIGIAPRINGAANAGCNCSFLDGKAVTCGSVIINETAFRVKKNIYSIVHTYPNAGVYTIRTFDRNRNQGVHNIPYSISLPFYVESQLVINNFTGANSSPVFAFDPIDRACLYECFEHNPGAYDPDGDSLSYELTTSRGENGQTVPNYFYPEIPSGGTYNINAITGLLTWCSPQFVDEYNIAFIVKEWRKNTSGVYQVIGYVLRDMQVIVKNCSNKPPSIIVPDVCVEAGTTVTANLVVKDPNHGDVVTVQGGGGAFAVPPPIATFNPNSGFIDSLKGRSFNVFFSWKTTCDHIRQQSYQTIFKVEDNNVNSTVKLVSFSTMNIRVVPPKIKNVTATPMGTNMRISWTPSVCNPLTNALVEYKIYRKQDCTPYVADPCQSGVPLASGFLLIGKTKLSFFDDDNNQEGLVVGQDYSYIVVATYVDGSETFGSVPVCARLKRDIPVMLNVDVDSTSATGSIWLRWNRPLTSAGNFDTTAFPGPYRFNVKHRSGTSGAYTIIQQFNSNFILKLDTQYLHKDLNTEITNEDYYIEFFSDTTLIGSSQKASSIFLTTTSTDRRIDLQWSSKTPWKNYNYSVMRKDSVSNYTLMGTTTLTAFADTFNLVNGSTYCYYVIGEGKYSDTTVFHPLINASQIACKKPLDNIPPAIPVITITADCPLGTVDVSWNDIRLIKSSDDAAKYLLFYKPSVTGLYQQVGEILANEPLTFRQDNPNSFSGCYSIKAVDRQNNESAMSPDFCIDNCPEFELPNIFSPNKDGVNDFFQAIRVRQIKDINLSIVDRWGNLVYTTKDPYFKWDGVSVISKVQVSEGTFFYVCDVYEPRLKGIVKRTLKGYLEVVR